MQVVCGHCGRSVRVAPEQMGAHARCPHCSHSLHIPGADEGGADALTDVDGYAAVARSAQVGRIRFACHHCGKRLAAPLELAGKPAQCLKCGRPVEIPHIDVDQTVRLAGEKASAAPDIVTADNRPDVTPTPVENGLDIAAPGPAGLTAAAMPETSAPGPPSPESFVEVPTVTPAAPVRKPPPRWAIWAIIGGALLATVVFVLAMAIDWSGERSPEPTVALPDPSPTPGADEPNETEGGPSERPSAVTIMPVMIRSIERSAFAGGGYRAAPPGREYWLVLARVLGGSGGVAFGSFGPAVTLTLGEEQYEAMGVVTGRSVFPLTGHQRRLTIQAGQKQYVTFLFEMPATAPGSDRVAGRLEISGAGGCDVWGPEAPAASVALTPGSYVEALPRNLPLAPEEGVLAEIQRAGTHTLVVDSEGDSVTVSLAEVSLSGVVSEDAQVMLRGAAGEVVATLRVAADCIILYLGAGPYACLTFATPQHAEAIAAQMLPLHDPGVEGLPGWATEQPVVEDVVQERPEPAARRPQSPRSPGGTIFD